MGRTPLTAFFKVVLWCGMTNRFPVRSGPNLYFLRNPLTGLVKIGSTKDVERRVRELECASGMLLELVRVFPGEGDQEKELHVALDDCRGLGEWFRPPRVLRYWLESKRDLDWLLMELLDDYEEWDATTDSEGSGSAAEGVAVVSAK